MSLVATKEFRVGSVSIKPGPVSSPQLLGLIESIQRSRQCANAASFAANFTYRGRTFDQLSEPAKQAILNGHLVVKKLGEREILGYMHANGWGFVEITATVEPTVYVGQNAMVLDFAVVSDRAKLIGHSTVLGNATVSGEAELRDLAVVSGNVRVSGNTKVTNLAVISGDTQISTGHIS